MHFSPSIGQDNSEITNKGGKTCEVVTNAVCTFSIHSDGDGMQ